MTYKCVQWDVKPYSTINLVAVRCGFGVLVGKTRFFATVKWLAGEVIFKMSYNVFSRMLNPTVTMTLSLVFTFVKTWYSNVFQVFSKWDLVSITSQLYDLRVRYSFLFHSFELAVRWCPVLWTWPHVFYTLPWTSCFYTGKKLYCLVTEAQQCEQD